MYIPEFWAGVIATALSELISVVLISVYLAKHDKQGEDNETKKAD